jgi:hypothetical protein
MRGFVGLYLFSAIHALFICFICFWFVYINLAAGGNGLCNHVTGMVFT